MKGKHITLAVTGAIAAYKAVHLLRLLRAAGAEVQVIGTEHSLHFIGAETWRALSGRPPLFSLWEQNDPAKISHIMLAQEVDLIIVAPATADILAKAAHGIADDLVSSVLLSATVPILFAPCMNTAMYEHPATQGNIAILANRPRTLVMPCGRGHLACGNDGIGRLAEPEDILATAMFLLTPKKEESLRWLVVAGSTREYFDPIRFISNGSTGLTGRATADAAWRQGDQVTFIAGNMGTLPNRYPVHPVVSGEEMYKTVMSLAPNCDILFMSAAVVDYAPLCSAHKIKKSTNSRILLLELEQTPDILLETASVTLPHCFRVGFAAETENLIGNARDKLERKNLDMVVANEISNEHNPFESTSNKVTIVTKDAVEDVPSMTKEELGVMLADRIHDASIRKRKC